MWGGPNASRWRLVVFAFAAALAVWLGWQLGIGIAHRRSEARARRELEAQQRAATRAQRAEAKQQRAEARVGALGGAVEDANRQLERAARAGDRRAVARLGRRLTELWLRDDAANGGDGSDSKDPFERELDRFPIKRAPLFAQQIISTEGEHVLYAAVYRPLFCLRSPQQRVRDVRATYRASYERLRGHGIDDFELLVIPTSSRATPARALATARDHRVLLRRGGC